MQTRLAYKLHREAHVPEGPCGLPELRQFQTFLGPQGYQILVVCPINCVLLYKEDTWNECEHKLMLVKNGDHYDGLTSLPSLLSRSYFCYHCNKGYNTEDARHHNCRGQNCTACLRKENQCPNFALWEKPSLVCDRCHISFFGPNCFQHHLKQKQCESYKNVWIVTLPIA